MWIVTREGFYSAVQKDGDTDLTVRARVKQDLTNLLPYLSGTVKQYPIITTPDNDYGFRIKCSHEDWACALAQLAREIDYSNFKREIGTIDPKRKDVLHHVWSALYELAWLGATKKITKAFRR